MDEIKINSKYVNNITFIEMNNPPVNALSTCFLSDFSKALDKIPADAKVVVFKSLVKGFSAGADLKERAYMDDKSAINTVSDIGELFQKIESVPCPTIARIEGFALGGGLELALSCDFRFATNDSVLGLPETSLGIIPGAGGTQRLVRLIGLSKAKKWIFTAKRFDAVKALEDGVIDKLFNASEQMDDFIDKFASDIKCNSQSAVSLSKKAINYAYGNSLEEGLSFERKQYLKTLDNPDRLENLKKFKK